MNKRLRKKRFNNKTHPIFQGIHRQQSGRGLRLFAGKENCIILDHAGGLPDTEVKWSLEGAKKRSMRMVDITAIKACPECIHTRPRCFCIFEGLKCFVCGSAVIGIQ